MPYIKRELERKFLEMNGFFKVVLVTGARQVGKTTMLKHLFRGNGTHICYIRRSRGSGAGAKRSGDVFSDLQAPDTNRRGSARSVAV